MEKSVIGASQRLGGLGTFLRKCMFSVVSVGPIPEHIAFIMDGNRRYAKRRNLPVAEGHKAGYLALMSILRDAAEKAMKATANNSKAVLLICVAYTSCDEIVHAVQESCNEKGNEIQALNGTKVSNGVTYGVERGEKINGVMECDVHKSCNGSLDGEAALDTSKPCSERYEADEKENTTVNHVEKDKGGEVASRICNGLIEDVQESEKLPHKIPNVKLVDVEKHLYMAVAPDPDIMIRTSGETRLSNFLLWQTSNCPLYSPAALWPELGLWHLVWAVLNFQRNHYYLEKKRKQM
ncbi:hypothetical protein PRUPE_7G181400 [Prunus persica]|uniref:Alkyl transferase n=1 Tax=Prunus persica TaxID=3760 RepID=A0A251ND62_PRUPE|nr:hypothetical protein PRUPE_7G181400 [Prunus persica]ONH97283.1 hypothetical protein PRUPE_7G181400 [Prunus persica]